MTMPCDDVGTSGVQRFEVFTGRGRRRDWAPETKASIVAESYSEAETVSAVARRYGMSPSQLFTWRREFRKQLEDRGLTLPVASPASTAFVPAVIEPEPACDPPPAVKRSRRQRRSKASVVELEIDGVAVKIGRGADVGVIAAVIEALKATR